MLLMLMMSAMNIRPGRVVAAVAALCGCEPCPALGPVIRATTISW
jgi:hypothetical protein